MIDREKVILGLEYCSQQRGGPELCEQCPYYNEPFSCANVLLHDALAMLKEQEVKHGHWVIFEEQKEVEGIGFSLRYYYCSNCGDCNIMDRLNKIPGNYCKNCGAKMDE